MLRPQHIALLLVPLTTVLLLAPAASSLPTQLPVRLDAYGDPLPPDAIARLGTNRLRHPGPHAIKCVAFSQDGKHVLSANQDGITV